MANTLPTESSAIIKGKGSTAKKLEQAETQCIYSLTGYNICANTDRVIDRIRTLVFCDGSCIVYKQGKDVIVHYH